MRVVLAALLLLATTPAWAEWVRLDADQVRVVRIDPATMLTDSNLRRVWQMQDRKAPTPNGERSLRSQVEFDCKELRWRALSLFTYSGPKLTGTAIVGETPAPGEWSAVVTGTLAETMLGHVCSQ